MDIAQLCGRQQTTLSWETLATSTCHMLPYLNLETRRVQIRVVAAGFDELSLQSLSDKRERVDQLILVLGRRLFCVSGNRRR